MSAKASAKKREAKAFRAMKDLLDLPQAQVRPKLKDLLKVYDNNWTYIEADEYRVLIDAIFESKDVPAAEKPKRGSGTQAAAEPCLKIVNAENDDEVEEEETEALVHPSKRLRRNREGQTSSLNRCSNAETKALTIEPSNLPETLPHMLNGSRAIVQSPYPNGMNSLVESQTETCTDPCERKRTQPKRKSSTTALIENKYEPVKDDVPLLEAPVAVPHPDLSNGGYSLSRDGKNRGNHYSDLSTQLAILPETVSSDKVKNNKLVTGSDENSIGLVSPPFGEVKISMSCNLAHEKLNFQPPSFEAVLKSVEEDCLRTYKFLPSNFSLMDVMKNMCQTYIELGSNYKSEPHKIVDVSAATALQNGSSALDARNLCVSSVKESEISHSNVELPLPILPPTTPRFDEVDNGYQLNETIVRDQKETGGEVTDNLSLVTVPDTIRPVHQGVGDVAKGQENISISLVNVELPLLILPPTTPHFDEVDNGCQLNETIIRDQNETDTEVTDKLSLVTVPDTSRAVHQNVGDVAKGQENISIGLVNVELPLLILPPATPHFDEVDNGCQLNETIVRDQNETDSEVTDNPSLVTVPDTIRPVHQDVGDVAKGQENISIGLVNGISDSLPRSFYYIPLNTVFCDANVNISLSRIGDEDCCFTCSGDCLSSATPCACACANGGKCAYTKDGILKEELLNNFISLNNDQKKKSRFFCEECPLERVKRMNNTESCKGHLVRKIVTECWVKCGCDKLRGNKVVQRGITRNLQVFMTPDGKGWGLRTLEDLPKGSFVCEYVGEILTVAESFRRGKQFHSVLLDAGWSDKGVRKDEDALCLDCTYYGNVARFMNHRCHDSNMVEVPVAVETPDRHYYHVAFFTTRDVTAMEELNWDYGIDFDDKDNPIKAFRCLCGSTFCRYINSSSK